MADSGRALGLPDLEARFTARGRWRERLPVILDTLEALGCEPGAVLHLEPTRAIR